MTTAQMAANSGKGDVAKKATIKLAQAAAAGDGDALRAIAEIADNWTEWTGAKGKHTEVKKECKDKTDAAGAALKQSIEASLPATPNKQQVLVKLQGIEQSWQEAEEVKAEAIERKKETRDNVKLFAEKLDRSIQDSAQLALDFRHAGS